MRPMQSNNQIKVNLSYLHDMKVEAALCIPFKQFETAEIFLLFLFIDFWRFHLARAELPRQR